MVALSADPQFVPILNQRQGTVRPPSLEAVAQLLKGGEEQAALADKGE